MQTSSLPVSGMASVEPISTPSFFSVVGVEERPRVGEEREDAGAPESWEKKNIVGPLSTHYVTLRT